MAWKLTLVLRKCLVFRRAVPMFYLRLIIWLFMLMSLPLANWNSIISKASTSLDKMYHINITFVLHTNAWRQAIFMIKKKKFFPHFLNKSVLRKLNFPEHIKGRPKSIPFCLVFSVLFEKLRMSRLQHF